MRRYQLEVSYLIYLIKYKVVFVYFFFFNDTATTEIYTLSLHDALPISATGRGLHAQGHGLRPVHRPCQSARHPRSEEHTSELQSQSNLVCRLLLEKKKKRLQITRPRRASHRTHIFRTLFLQPRALARRH